MGGQRGQSAGGASYYQQDYQQQQPAGGASQQQSSHGGQQGQQQKHDVFVGNLAFSTTEEQLYQAFSEIGRIVKVRMVSDLETGKPRGFAFIEFEDPQAALSAIRNMNEYEINGRRIRVNFSNSSHLEQLAGQLGMDLSHVGAGGQKGKDKTDDKGAGAGGAGGVAGSKAVATSLKRMNKGEMYDVVAKLKEISDSDPDEARKLLTQHPQLPEAILYLMSELDMIKTPLTSAVGVPMAAPPSEMAHTSAPPPAAMPPPAQKPSDPRDPRARAPAAPAAPIAPPPPQPKPSDPRDPRARPSDPRAARDPRAAAPSFPPPPMQPPPMAQQQAPGVAGLDPNLIQQVMSLTPVQIAQLPPDKQQSILALRQQITGAGMQ